MKNRIDRTDLEILDLLQKHGRMTNVELASRIGISAPPCLRRVRALEEAGVIQGYCAITDPSALGFTLTAFAMVKLSSQSEAALRAFEEQVANWPIVRECYMLSGETDFILKCVARDLQEFQDFIINDLTGAPNVGGVKTSLTIKRSKLQAGVPIGETTSEPA